MKKIGMVIVNYNDYETTIKLINNVKNYKKLDLIVIVDNNSKDDSVSKIKEYTDDRIILLQNKENKGYASGLNIGAKYLNKYLKNCNIIFSNSDVIISKEEDIINLSNTIDDEIKVAGPIIKQNNEISRGWILPTTKDEVLFNLPLISRKLRKKVLYKEEIYNNIITQVDVVSGCFFVIDGKTLKDINYFDENTFLYYEENILAKKIKDINKREAINNNVSIIHEHSETIDKNITKINKYKRLKESQRYYVKQYLNANIIDLFFLFITNKLSLIILYVRCLIKK